MSYKHYSTSPVTLHQDWSQESRVIGAVAFGSFSTLCNVFFLSSFVITEKLQRPGNVLVAGIAVNDIILAMTQFIPMVVSILITAGDNSSTCRVQRYIVDSGTYATAWLHAIVAYNNAVMIYGPEHIAQWFNTSRSSAIFCVIMIASVACSVVGTYFDLDFDFCQRTNEADPYFLAFILIFFVMIPSIMTIYYQTKATYVVWKRFEMPQHRRSSQTQEDWDNTIANSISYYIFALLSVPPPLVFVFCPSVSDRAFYTLAWVCYTRSIFSSLIYGFLSKPFRSAYVKIFMYLFCKQSITSSLQRRRSRSINARNDARVNIIQMATYDFKLQRAKLNSEDNNL